MKPVPKNMQKLPWPKISLNLTCNNSGPTSDPNLKTLDPCSSKNISTATIWTNTSKSKWPNGCTASMNFTIFWKMTLHPLQPSSESRSMKSWMRLTNQDQLVHQELKSRNWFTLMKNWLRTSGKLLTKGTDRFWARRTFSTPKSSKFRTNPKARFHPTCTLSSSQY